MNNQYIAYYKDKYFYYYGNSIDVCFSPTDITIENTINIINLEARGVIANGLNIYSKRNYDIYYKCGEIVIISLKGFEFHYPQVDLEEKYIIDCTEVNINNINNIL